MYYVYAILHYKGLTRLHLCYQPSPVFSLKNIGTSPPPPLSTIIHGQKVMTSEGCGSVRG
jgi:hypothetical protein